ncbi:hypothetical protein [Afifella sp. YEN Y35]|uniref:hypothetical protein n=1 Tax=Afifella sp. YEN Y35 TaxID=3388337 RepID=UPI0039E0334D
MDRTELALVSASDEVLDVIRLTMGQAVECCGWVEGETVTAPNGKGNRWMLVVREDAPVDPEIEVATEEVVSVEADRVVKARGKRALTVDELMPRYGAAIQAHLDAVAAERRYDGISTGVSYRDDPDPGFAAEGQALFAWRSAVWAYAMSELAKVQSGTRAIVTPAESVAELPEFTWPEAS